MSTTFSFELITPERVYFSGQAAQVIIPGQMGEFGVLKGHAPFISTLKPGVVMVEDAQGQQQRYVVLSGVAEATAHKASVLAELVESLEGVTQESAKARLESAEQAMKDAISEPQKELALQEKQIAQTILAAA